MMLREDLPTVIPTTMVTDKAISKIASFVALEGEWLLRGCETPVDSFEGGVLLMAPEGFSTS